MLYMFIPSFQTVVPSLVANEVLEIRADGGARLRQVGGAKIFPGNYPFSTICITPNFKSLLYVLIPTILISTILIPIPSYLRMF
jgi:hypothetical protein